MECRHHLTHRTPRRHIKLLPDRRGWASVRQLAGGLHRPDAKGARDRAILRLLWDLGVRRSEVAELDLVHVDLDAGTVDVREMTSVGEEVVDAVELRLRRSADRRRAGLRRRCRRRGC